MKYRTIPHFVQPMRLEINYAFQASKSKAEYIYIYIYILRSSTLEYMIY